MVSIMSFDSKCVIDLLDSKNSACFDAEFPIFYKNKIRKSNNKNKYYYLSPIDIALKHN